LLTAGLKLNDAEDEQFAKSAFDGTFSQIICIARWNSRTSLEPRGSVAWYGGMSGSCCDNS
jgi:hypothetical protein